MDKVFRRVHFNLSLLQCLIGVLIFGLVAGISGSQISARVTNINRYGCVAYGDTLLDIASGKTTRRHLTPTPMPDNTPKLVSPDGKYILTVQDATITNRPSVTLSKVGAEQEILSRYFEDLPDSKTASIQFKAWSSDSQYVAIVIDNKGVYILSIPDLRLAVSSLLPDVHWSNSGHRFAYIDKQLILATPDNPVQQKFDIPANYIIHSWSPTDEYLAFDRPNDPSALSIVYQWYVLNLQNRIFYPTTGTSAQVGENESYPRPFALWSGNGRLWIYLTQNITGYALMGLHPDSGIYEALNRGDIEPNGNILTFVDLSPDKRFVAFRAVRDGKKAIDMMKVADGSVSTLFSGEDRFLSGPNFISGGSIVIAAILSGDAAADHTSRLVWANADGTGLHQFEETFTAISSFHLLQGGDWIAYIITRPDWYFQGGSGIEIANLKTGENHILVYGLTMGVIAEYEWNAFPTNTVYPSPDGRTFLILRGPVVNFAQEALDIIQLDNQRTITYHAGRIGEVAWAPDGTMFVFSISSPSNMGVDKLIIADAKGNKIRVQPIDPNFYDYQPITFTSCG